MFGKIWKFGAALLAGPVMLSGTALAQSGEAAILLFSGENYQGEVREVFEPIAALPVLRFNDRSRSVAVLSGAWEVCEHSDFTGRCVLLREDVSDLRIFRMNRNISSVRPIYEYTDAAHGLMFIRNRDGSIRYADRSFNGYDNYAYDDYSYGYQSSLAVNFYHYGHSPDYRRHGYYHPRAGFGPYGFGYVRPGHHRARHDRHNRHYGHRRDRGHHRHNDRRLRGHYGARDGAVTLYTDSRGRGASLGINRGVRDLSRFRFNDRASSIDIREGRWEVCEHANFRGRCEIVDASVDRLNGLRLNDNISSIRPVGDRPRTGRRGGRDDIGRRGRRGHGGDTDRPRRPRGEHTDRRRDITDIDRPRRPRGERADRERDRSGADRTRRSRDREIGNRARDFRGREMPRPPRSRSDNRDRRQQRQNSRDRSQELAGGREGRRERRDARPRVERQQRRQPNVDRPRRPQPASRPAPQPRPQAQPRPQRPAPRRERLERQPKAAPQQRERPARQRQFQRPDGLGERGRRSRDD